MIPILNAISTIKDIVELALLFKRLLKGEYGGSGGDGDGDGSSTDAAPPATSPSETVPTGSQPGELNARDPNAPEGSNPAARAVLDAVTRHGGSGPQLDETQRQLLHASIPRDLTPEQIREVIELLRRDGEKAGSTADIVVAIDLAVRAVRNRTRTVTVNGQRQEVSATPAKPDGPVTSPSQLEGPVTSPRDVDRSQSPSGATTDERVPATPLAVVQTGAASVVGTWFEERDGELVLSSRGAEWRSNNADTMLSAEVMLETPRHEVQAIKDGWLLTLTFPLLVDGSRRNAVYRYHVTRADGPNGKLQLERYTLIQVGG